MSNMKAEGGLDSVLGKTGGPRLATLVNDLAASNPQHDEQQRHARSLRVGQTVAFRRPCVHCAETAAARGTVVSVQGRVAKVDFAGTWFRTDSGSTVRAIPCANLAPVSGGIVLDNP